MTQPATISAMLADAAARHPKRCFLRTADGELSYAETEWVGSLAGGFAELGIGPGTPVVLCMGNSIDQVLVWFALARLGALHIPINPALVGASLVAVSSSLPASSLSTNSASATISAGFATTAALVTLIDQARAARRVPAR